MDIYKKPLLWIIKGGLFLVPFVPLYISRSLFFPYITGKAFIFRTIVEIVFAAWIFLAIFYSEYRPRRTVLFWAILAWLAVVTFASVFGENVIRSIWSNFERMEGLVAYVHLAAYFLVLSSVFKKNDWIIFFTLFVVSGFIENIYGILQHFGYLVSPQGGMNRVDGTIGNPTYLAAYLIFIAAFSLFLFFELHGRWLRGVLAASTIFTLIIIYYTATRGATIALLGGVFLAGTLYLFFAPPSPFRHRARIGVCVFLMLVILIAGSLWFFKESSLVHDNPVLSRLTSLSLTQRTVESRFKIWAMGLEGFKEHPILGWGPENYNIVFAKYFNPELWRQEPWFDRSHNVVLDWLINAGILGLLSFLGMLFFAGYSLWKGYRNNAISFYGFLIFGTTFAVYFVQNFFVFDQIATYISLFALFAFAQAHTEPYFASASHRPQSMYAPFVLIILAVLAVATVYGVNGKAYSANRNLLDGLKGGDINTAFSYYQKALSSGPLGRSEAVEQFIRFALTAGGTENVDAKLKDSVLRRALEAAEGNITENPQDPRAYLFLGNLYQNIGMSDKAIQTLNQAIALSPTKQQIYFELADAYMRNGDLGNAIRVSEIAYALAPDFNQARTNLAVVYILYGDQEKADALFSKHYGALDVPEEFVGRAYAQMADRFRNEGNAARAQFYIDRFIGVRKALLEQDVSVLSNYTDLAKIYLIVGQQQEAVAVLNAAIAHNSAWKGDIEQFLKDIGFKQ